MTPLKIERLRRQLSQMAVAEAVGITQSHFAKLEKAKVSASPEVANRIALHFGNAVTRDQILYPEDYAKEGARKHAPKARQLQAAG